VTDGIPAAPVIIQRETVDSSPYNGKIDRIRLVFSSTVDDSTAQTSGFTVSGYTISSINSGGTANDAELFLVLSEGGAGDTAAVPDIRYVGSTLRAPSAGAYVVAEGAAIAATDKAGPAIVSASTYSPTSVQVTFSEPVSDASIAGIDLVFSSFSTVAANAAALSVATGSTANDAVVLATLAASIGGDETGNVRIAAASRLVDLAAEQNMQTATVSVTDGIPANAAATGFETGDADSNGKIDRLVIRFNKAVNVTDGNAGDGFGSVVVAGYTVANKDYAASGVTSLSLDLVEGGSADTGATPSVTLSTSTAIKDAVTAIDVGALTAAASDKAGPAILSAQTKTRTTVELTFSEAMSDASLAGSDFVFSGFTTSGANASGASVSTGSTANDAVAVVTLAATIGGNETGFVKYSAAGRTADLAANMNSQTATITVADGVPAVAIITARETVDSSPYNGKIDRIRLVFSDSMNDATVVAGEFTVAGYTVASIDTGSTANDAEFFLVLTEGGSPDSSAIPSIRYIGTTLRDMNAGTIAVEGSGTVATDKAGPAIVSAQTKARTTVELTFSEAMSDASLAGSDFTFSGFTTTTPSSAVAPVEKPIPAALAAGVPNPAKTKSLPARLASETASENVTWTLLVVLRRAEAIAGPALSVDADAALSCAATPVVVSMTRPSFVKATLGVAPVS
jgi:hypothetical protein